MNKRILSLSVALVLAIAPAFADTTTNSATTVAPSNSQYVSPTTNSNASTSNVSTQINNNNLGANSYGQGITCQSPQVALGGFGSRDTAGVGLPDSNAGFTVQYLTPVGSTATRSCQALATEVLHQRTLDTQLTMIQKCADFSRAGIILDPTTYPELARACAGIHLSIAPAGAAPMPAYPRSNAAVPSRVNRETSMVPSTLKIHLSDFSPAHNTELARIASHRLERLAMLKGRQHAGHLNSSERVAMAAHVDHETTRLRAVIAEYQLENTFLHRIAADKSWHASTAADIRGRILSYVPAQQGS